MRMEKEMMKQYRMKPNKQENLIQYKELKAPYLEQVQFGLT